jgi:hypothetical protein
MAGNLKTKQELVNWRKYGNPTSLETESPTLPPGRFNVPDLRSDYLPTPPALSWLHHSIHADGRVRTLVINDIDRNTDIQLHIGSK